MESVRAMLDAAIDRNNRTGRGGGRGGGERQPGLGQSAPFRAGGGFSGRYSEPPARHQLTTYNANDHAVNKEYHSDDHAVLRAIVQPPTFVEASSGAGGDNYDD